MTRRPRASQATWGSIGGLMRVVNTSPEELAEQMRRLQDRFLLSFERKADPEGVMTPEERARRALLLRRAHMKRLRTMRRTPSVPPRRSA